MRTCPRTGAAGVGLGDAVGLVRDGVGLPLEEEVFVVEPVPGVVGATAAGGWVVTVVGDEASSAGDPAEAAGPGWAAVAGTGSEHAVRATARPTHRPSVAAAEAWRLVILEP